MSGKSVIFNYLTGKYVTVSNYPGTTVEVTRGALSGSEKNDQVIDTPGVNSLIPMSEDEKVTRDILLHGTPDPSHPGDGRKEYPPGACSFHFSCWRWVFPFSSFSTCGMRQKAGGSRFEPRPSQRSWEPRSSKRWPRGERASKRSGRISDRHALPRSPSPIPRPSKQVSPASFPSFPRLSISRRSLALMLLAGDESLTDWLHQNLSEEAILQIEAIRHEIQNHSAEPIGYLINQARLRKVDEILSDVMSTSEGILQEPLRLDRKSFDPSLLGSPDPSPRSVHHV